MKITIRPEEINFQSKEPKLSDAQPENAVRNTLSEYNTTLVTTHINFGESSTYHAPSRHVQSSWVRVLGNEMNGAGIVSSARIGWWAIDAHTHTTLSNTVLSPRNNISVEEFQRAMENPKDSAATRGNKLHLICTLFRLQSVYPDV